MNSITVNKIYTGSDNNLRLDMVSATYKKFAQIYKLILNQTITDPV